MKSDNSKHHVSPPTSATGSSTPPAKPSPEEPVLADVEKLTGPDPLSNLYDAVGRYVESNGGKVLVIGGVQVQQWPGDQYTFYIAVKCTGRLPALAKARGGESDAG